MEKEKCIEVLQKQGYKVEEDQHGIIYCYECEDHEAFRKAVIATGYKRSFGSTPRKKNEIRTS